MKHEHTKETPPPESVPPTPDAEPTEKVDFEAEAAKFKDLALRTAADLDNAARAKIDPSRIVWVVVGDAAKIRPQLAKLGLPVEEMKAAP